MTYNHQAAASQDTALRLRVAACIATQDPASYEVPSFSPSGHPLAIADAIMWQCCGQPGWAEAYSYAEETNVPDPGRNEGVITDAVILSGVQAVLGVIAPT